MKLVHIIRVMSMSIYLWHLLLTISVTLKVNQHETEHFTSAFTQIIIFVHYKNRISSMHSIIYIKTDTVKIHLSIINFNINSKWKTLFPNGE